VLADFSPYCWSYYTHYTVVGAIAKCRTVIKYVQVVLLKIISISSKE
jgi:hypothetical protein